MRSYRHKAGIHSRRDVKAIKEHTCYWCGETIERGDQHASIRWKRNYLEAVNHFRLHHECSEALDNALFHDVVPAGQRKRGEYDCPYGLNGDCDICCDTPFRRLPRGINKPALQGIL